MKIFLQVFSTINKLNDGDENAEIIKGPDSCKLKTPSSSAEIKSFDAIENEQLWRN